METSSVNSFKTMIVNVNYKSFEIFIGTWYLHRTVGYIFSSVYTRNRMHIDNSVDLEIYDSVSNELIDHNKELKEIIGKRNRITFNVFDSGKGLYTKSVR